MPNGLIVLIIIVLALAFTGIFVTVRYGPPKDARRRQVKAAEERARRATRALRDVEHRLRGTVLLDDIVASDMRQQCLQIITTYQDKELEIEAK